MSFWLNNPSILLKPEIFPDEKMSHTEKLNAVARFALVFLILVYLFEGDLKWMSFSVSLLVLTIIFNKNMEKLDQVTCHPKTVDNPFGNFTVGDYMVEPNRLEVCNPMDIKQSEKLAEKGIPLIADFYHRDVALRNFYTQPVTTIVNRQNEFAKFLLGTTSGECKTNGNNCLENHDTRFHRGRYFNGNQ
jgi:hypothetical protein